MKSTILHLTFAFVLFCCCFETDLKVLFCWQVRAFLLLVSERQVTLLLERIYLVLIESLGRNIDHTSEWCNLMHEDIVRGGSFT